MTTIREGAPVTVIGISITRPFRANHLLVSLVSAKQVITTRTKVRETMGVIKI